MRFELTKMGVMPLALLGFEQPAGEPYVHTWGYAPPRHGKTVEAFRSMLRGLSRIAETERLNVAMNIASEFGDEAALAYLDGLNG